MRCTTVSLRREYALSFAILVLAWGAIGGWAFSSDKGDMRHGSLIIPQSGATRLTSEQALALAMQQTGGGVVVKQEMHSKRDGRVEYEFDIINNGVKYEVEIDSTGAILEFERKKRAYPTQLHPVAAGLTAAPAPSAAAGPASAPLPSASSGLPSVQSMVKEAFEQGTVSEYKLDTDSTGRTIHKVVMTRDGKRYDAKLADDGTVLEMSVKDSQ